MADKMGISLERLVVRDMVINESNNLKKIDEMPY